MPMGFWGFAKMWVERFVKHGNGIMLINWAKSKWFDYLWEHVDGCIPLPPNMSFVKPNGSES